MGRSDSASAGSAPRSQRPVACAYAPCAGAGLQLVEPTARRGELGSDWRAVPLQVRLGKAGGRNPSRCASEQSDRLIVP